MKRIPGQSKWAAMLAVGMAAGMLTTGATDAEASSTKVEYCCYYMPDLEVTKIKTSTSKPKRNKAFNVTVTIRNRGTTSIDLSLTPFWLDLYLHEKHCVAPNYGGEYYTYLYSGVLHPGQSMSYTFHNVYYYKKGKHYMRAFADSFLGVYECNEANNQSRVGITVD